MTGSLSYALSCVVHDQKYVNQKNGICMLVLTRNSGEFILVFNTATKAMLGMIAVVDKRRSQSAKIGMQFDQSIGLIRQEHTQFRSYTFDQMLGVALGTILEITPCAKPSARHSQGSTNTCQPSLQNSTKN